MSVSLHRRLIVILLGLTLLTWLVSVGTTAIYARHLMVKQIDRHLQQYTQMAQYTMEGVLADPEIRRYFWARSTLVSSNSESRRVASFDDADSGNAINLWFGKRQILIGEDAPIFPRPEAEGTVTKQLEDGSRWRILYSYSPQFNVWRAVAVDLEIARQGGMGTFWLGVLPLFFILPITLAVLFLGVRRGLRPLNDLAEQIAARKPRALEAFSMRGVPTEMQPVVRSLNDLLDRLHRAVTSEQRFTANAAHELQTPLAAIQTAVQSCQRQLRDLPECGDVQLMLERVSSRIGSASYTVRQLLTLARLDPDQEFDRQPVDLGYLLAEVMADLGGLAVERQISIAFDKRARVLVSGNAEWLRILLSNLFANAFKYSSSPGEVKVVLEHCQGYSRLTIANDCDPIPDQEFQRLTERFYHPSKGTNHGVGLGLSIVERIAELHNAELTLHSSRDIGFLVEIRFPASRPSVKSG